MRTPRSSSTGRPASDGARFGSPGELPRIESRSACEKTAAALPDWRITCFFVRKGHRRQGVSADALSGALDLIAGMGGGLVEGHPDPAGSVPAGSLFNGALSTFERLGFERDRMIGRHRRVVTATVAPRGQLEPPPERLGVTHWSTRLLAGELGVGDATVARAWRRYHIQPWRQGTFRFSTDPELEAKVRDVVGLYLDPPKKAIVLCVDEKSQLQALDRTQPILPLRPGSRSIPG